MIFWVLWLVVAIGLAIAELHSGDFTLLMLSGGGVAGLITSLIVPDLLWVQVIVAAAAAGLLLWALRPTLLRRVHSMPGYRSSLDRMVGSSGLVTQAITADAGEVKINGEAWSARSLTGADIPVETPVDVYEIDGTFLMVAVRPQLPDGYAPIVPGIATPAPGAVMPPSVLPTPPVAPLPGLGTPPATGTPDYWARPQG